MLRPVFGDMYLTYVLTYIMCTYVRTYAYVRDNSTNKIMNGALMSGFITLVWPTHRALGGTCRNTLKAREGWRIFRLLSFDPS